MDSSSQPEKYKRIFAQRLAEECQGRHWPEDQWQKKLMEITGAKQATVSRWLNGESIPHPLARQALSKEFDKLDSYWLGGKTEHEIQMDIEPKPSEPKSMELQERPFGHSQRGPAEEFLRRADYTVFAASELKRMLKNLTERLVDTPDARTPAYLDQIELIVATLRVKLRESRRPPEAGRPRPPGQHGIQ